VRNYYGGDNTRSHYRRYCHQKKGTPNARFSITQHIIAIISFEIRQNNILGHIIKAVEIAS